MLIGPYYRLLIEHKTRVGTFDNPFLTATNSSTSSPNQLGEEGKDNLRKQCNYFKSLMLLNQRDKNNANKQDNQQDKPAIEQVVITDT